jgi:hypothetical protein
MREKVFFGHISRFEILVQKPDCYRAFFLENEENRPYTADKEIFKAIREEDSSNAFYDIPPELPYNTRGMITYKLQIESFVHEDKTWVEG